MTNADKYLKEGVSVEEFIDRLVSFAIINGDHIKHRTIRAFLEVPIKPTLTEDERVILRNIKYTALDKIKRTSKGALYIEHFWIDYGEQIRFLYDNLFQFIKERRRIRDKGAVK